MFTGTLFPFQDEAREAMVERGSMMLAFYMGLGKTPTTIAACETLCEDGEADRVLVVVPASLKYQWLREIKKFTNSKAIVIDGSPSHRELAWKMATRFRYAIVNPETAINDADSIRRYDYQVMVIDEATIIKSNTAKRTKMLKRLGKRALYRFALTGQPIENRPEELFSIMQFVDPDVLGDFETFDQTFIVRDYYGKPLRYRNLEVLHKAMQECMVRKTRSDVADQLPKIVSQLVPVEFDPQGAALYRIMARDLQNKISEAVGQFGKTFNLFAHYHGGDDSMKAQGQIMSRLTCLRMLCDNPELLRISAAMRAEADAVGMAGGSAYAQELAAAGKLDKATKAPKLEATIEMIEEILGEHPDNKVVLFSFFKENLRIIQAATAKLTQSVLFMGGMTAPERDKAKQRFALDPQCRLFLSSDAGGYGVDLPMANYLISYDLPWSAGKIDQREARIVRLSSTWPEITLISMVMEGSVEEHQYNMLEQKRGIGSAIIDGKHDPKGNFELTLQSLTAFLASSSVI